MTKLEQQPLEKRKTPVVRRVTILRDRASAPGLLPATVLGWIPFWWSRVLFPGQSDSHRASRWHTALLILLPGLLLYPCLGFHLFEPDEGRYAQIPREMLTHNEWIVPTLQSEPYLDKPPLFYWTVMLAFSVFGYHTWTARLVPALATHGAILVTYFLGRRLVGARPAFWGALILSLAPAFIGVSRLLLLDGLLTLFTTTAILAAYVALRGATLHRGWWYLAALAGGFALLTKGPVAVVLLVPPLWLTRRLEPYRCPLPWRHVLGFLGVVFAVNVPWYAAILLREPEFGWYFFVQHNLQRFVDPFDHERPVSFFVPIVLFGMLPATLLLPAAVRFLFSSRPEATRQRSLPLGHLLLSGLWCFLFFSLSGSKLPTYILPAFPPLALALCCLTCSDAGLYAAGASGPAGPDRAESRPVTHTSARHLTLVPASGLADRRGCHPPPDREMSREQSFIAVTPSPLALPRPCLARRRRSVFRRFRSGFRRRHPVPRPRRPRRDHLRQHPRLLRRHRLRPRRLLRPLHRRQRRPAAPPLPQHPQRRTPRRPGGLGSAWVRPDPPLGRGELPGGSAVLTWPTGTKVYVCRSPTLRPAAPLWPARRPGCDMVRSTLRPEVLAQRPGAIPITAAYLSPDLMYARD